MQCIFDTGKIQKQLVRAEKIHFRAITSGVLLKTELSLYIMCVHTFEEVQHGYTKAEKAGCY